MFRLLNKLGISEVLYVGIFRKLNRPVATTIGMFDLFKGIAMLLIVFMHNRSLFPSLWIDKISSYNEEGLVKFLPYVREFSFLFKPYLAVILALVVAFIISLMPALFILTGYSLRKRKIGKSVSQLLKELLKPYLVTAILSVILNCIIHFSTYRYLPSAVDESLKLLSGMLLGSSRTVQFGDIVIFANGPIWFFLALFWSTIILNALLNYVDEKKISHYVFIISLLGWALSYVPFLPFCLSQGLSGVIYVYIGYYLRRKKVLTTSHSVKEIVLYTVIVVIPNIIFVALGYITEMADNIYSLGPITYIENGFLGVGILYIFMRLDDLCSGKVSNALRLIGRYSLYFLCMHSIEMVAVPWYILAEKLGENPVAAFGLIYCFRLGLILIGCFVALKIKKLTVRKRS